MAGVALSSCAGPQTEGNVAVEQVEQNSYSNVSVQDLQQVAANPQGVIIMDVRTDGEVAEGMVPNAIQNDVNGNNFKENAAALDKNTTVYVYCRSGGRSQTASQILVEMGFTDVRNVEGGYMAYQKL